MSIHRCCIVSLSIMFFLSNSENMGSQGKLIDCGWFKDFFAHHLEVLLNVGVQ